MENTIEQLYIPAVRTSVQWAVDRMQEQIEQLAATIQFIENCKDLTGGGAVINSAVTLRLETAQTSVDTLRSCAERLKEDTQ